MKPLRIAWLCVALLLSACGSLPERQRVEAQRIIDGGRATTIDCDAADHCAQPSELLAIADASAGAQHHALILDHGQDALLARLHMIRAARESIDLQTYIYDDDDSARLTTRELLAAARRGVKVRMLLDQLTAMKSARNLAAVAGAHANLEIRIYNPVLGKGNLSYADFALATLCCFRRINQRMHSKLLLVDGRLAITGGRNYQDDYFDWDSEYNFRDRDLLLGGPVAREMGENFEAFWRSRRSVPAQGLRDVARVLRREGIPPVSTQAYDNPERVRAMQQAANDPEVLRQRLLARTRPVEGVEFVGDLPQKHRSDADEHREKVAPSSDVLYRLIDASQEEVLLQTPYLVLSKPAQKLFETLHQRPRPPRVLVSTNSLAATDAFMVYALSHKYKRRYLRRYGFEIYEFKPYPQDSVIELVPPDAAGEVLKPLDAAELARLRQVPMSPWSSRTRREYLVQRRLLFGSRGSTVPLERGGVRAGLHAKSLVVDEGVGVIGTHNFDPRGDNYNTESAVIIRDPAFARALADSIRDDMRPENAWVMAPRQRTPLLPKLNYTLLRISENLPVFDLMPLRYATSYEFVPGPNCPFPLRIRDPRFHECYRPVGDFPEVQVGAKWFATRVLTAFGAGLAPIL